MKKKKKISEYKIKCNDKSSFIIILSADKNSTNINVQNTEKITSSFFEGKFYFDKLIKIDKYFENFENNFTLYSYFNYIFKNNKVSFNYEDNELNLKMKFKVNQKLKEITFPLEKKNINLEQSFLINKVLSKLSSNLEEKLKRKNDEIKYLKNNNNKINIDSKIIQNENEYNYLIKSMKKEEGEDISLDKTKDNELEEIEDNQSSIKSKSKVEIEYKLLFNVSIYDENIINQLIDFSIQYNNQCLALVEFENTKIGIIFTHKKEGNYLLIVKDLLKYNILDFYIDKEKFYFKLENKDSNEKDYSKIVKCYFIKEFIQMEFFNCLITK